MGFSDHIAHLILKTCNKRLKWVILQKRIDKHKFNRTTHALYIFSNTKHFSKHKPVKWIPITYLTQGIKKDVRKIKVDEIVYIFFFSTSTFWAHLIVDRPYTHCSSCSYHIRQYKFKSSQSHKKIHISIKASI